MRGAVHRRPGPGLLAHVLVAKYGDHLPLYRQSQMFEREGIDLDRSTLADWVGKSAALLEPLADAIGRHVLGGAAIFADDTPIQLQAPGNGKTKTARIWTYVRDERPWHGPDPPAACYRFTVDRKGEHPANHLAGYKGWMHADGYAGFNELFRSGGVREVACLAHIRRKFVDVFQAEGSFIAEEALKRIAGLYAIEKEGRGQPTDERVRLRQAHARPIVDDLESWLQAQLPRISGKSELAKAIRYALARMRKLRPYLDHGSLEADNNGAERALKPVALGRKNFLFVGSEGGGKSAAIAYTLIGRRNSTASTRKPGSPTYSAASPTTRSPGSTSCCLGVTLRPQRNWPPVKAPGRRSRTVTPDRPRGGSARGQGELPSGRGRGTAPARLG